MKKQRIELTKVLNSKSPNIIWKLIGTQDGLSRWIADEVTISGNTITFRWGNTWEHHEIKHATITEHEKLNRIKIRWVNEEDEDAYMEMRMEKSILTNDFTLHITDYGFPEEIEGLEDIWNDNMERLHRISGL